MKRIATLLGVVLVSFIGVSRSAMAQVPASEESNPATETACMATTPVEQLALNAAKNEARQMAEFTNGGLTVYRAEPAMHGSVVNAPCEVVSPGLWRFTIRGGDPVAVSTEGVYTILSVVTVDNVSGAGRSVNLEYNGPIEDYEE